MANIHHTVITAAARDIAAALPIPDGWPAAGRVWPVVYVLDCLKRAKWPTVQVEVSAPRKKSNKPGSLPHSAHGALTATVVPRAWLVALATKLEVPASSLVRAKIEDEE